MIFIFFIFLYFLYSDYPASACQKGQIFGKIAFLRSPDVVDDERVMREQCAALVRGMDGSE